jgi:hypothetical protein
MTLPIHPNSHRSRGLGTQEFRCRVAAALVRICRVQWNGASCSISVWQWHYSTTLALMLDLPLVFWDLFSGLLGNSVSFLMFFLSIDFSLLKSISSFLFHSNKNIGWFREKTLGDYLLWVKMLSPEFFISLFNSSIWTFVVLVFQHFFLLKTTPF